MVEHGSGIFLNVFCPLTAKDKLYLKKYMTDLDIRKSHHANITVFYFIAFLLTPLADLSDGHEHG